VDDAAYIAIKAPPTPTPSSPSRSAGGFEGNDPKDMSSK